MKRFSVIMLLLLVFMTVPAMAGEVGTEPFIHGGTVFGAIIILIIGLGVGYLVGRRNPNLVSNIKKELEGVKKDRSKLIVDFLKFKSHLRKEIRDFPGDVKKRIEDLLDKDDEEE